MFDLSYNSNFFFVPVFLQEEKTELWNINCNSREKVWIVRLKSQLFYFIFYIYKKKGFHNPYSHW